MLVFRKWFLALARCLTAVASAQMFRLFSAL
jgi:hypothetical protein